MSDFVYMFGYEDVDDEMANRETGSDFESAGFFKIRAESAKAALEWGRTLSDWYVAAIFGDDEVGRWSSGQFAEWIEEEPDELLRDALAHTVTVTVGQYPDLKTTRLLLHD